MVSLNDLNNDDRILGNKDIKQTQMYTHTWLADAKKKKLKKPKKQNKRKLSLTVLDLADQVK